MTLKPPELVICWNGYGTLNAPAATGNGIYVSDNDLAGPYDLVTKRATSVASGLQKYSKTITDAAPSEESLWSGYRH